MEKTLNRRSFLKAAGGTALAMSSAGFLSGCGRKTGADASEGLNPGEMTYRTNKGNNDKVSILGYGCMRWPMKSIEEGKKVIDQDEVNRLVDHALACGVNYFDAAPVYLQAECEAATGEALSRHPRESYYIATKLSNFKDASREEGIRMYKASLEAFRTDHIDYYLLHSIKDGETFRKRFLDNGLIDFLMEERKAGHIRNLGFSFHGNQQGFDELMALHEKYHWDFVQIQLNYMDWNHAGRRNTNASYLQAELDKRGIPSIIMEPLLGGRLADAPDHIVDRLKEMNPQGSIASWAFRFAGSHDGVLTVLSGMSCIEHLQDNLKTYSPLVPLTDQEKAVLEDIARLRSEYPEIPCTQCQYCMPCPYGLDIPSIFTHYNKCVNEGFINDDKEDSEYRKDRRAYLVSYDRAIPTLRQADRCISCGICVSKCPQHIAIPGEIRKIDLYVENLKRSR
jgi:predicted aldo/keto reductase-like oxidoreductase